MFLNIYSKKNLMPMDLINDILRKMNVGGNNPKNRTPMANCFSIFLFICLCICFTLGTLFIKTNEYKALGFCMRDSLIMVAMWQGILKTWTSRKKDPQINKLINIVDKKFWDDDYLNEAEIKSLQSKYKLLLIMKTILELLFAAAYGSIVLQVYLDTDQCFVFNMWLPDYMMKYAVQTPVKHLIMFFQLTCTIILGMTLLVQFDNIFIVLIGVCLVEIRKLKYKLTIIGTNRMLKGDFDILKECVAHHNLLLTFLADIEVIFSPVVLQMLGTNMIADVVTLCGFLVEENIANKIGFAIANIMATSQFFLYCLLGQIIQDETIAVADAAYDSKWEEILDQRVRRGLVLVIQRSHKYCMISMGGFLILNLENFTNVARMVMSILTLFMGTKE